jgi:hypothetical protein
VTIDRQSITTCYLCGEALLEPISDDHVPPKQLYGKDVRKSHNPNLLTLPVHKSCNHSYQNDEDYFVYSMSSFAVRTYSGKSVMDDIKRRFEAGEQQKLLSKVWKEWEKRPSGLVLPGGTVVKRIEGSRIHRIAWKVVRGLFFFHEGKVLPEASPNHIEYVAPETRPPEPFFALNGQPNLGQYPAVFYFKYKQFSEANNLWYWAMLFWAAFMVLMVFHDPECKCDTCQELTVKKT